MTKRVCVHCKVERDITEYYRDSSGPGGRKSRCKECFRNVAPIGKKVCSRCGLEKVSNAFYRDRTVLSGLKSKCIACCLERTEELKLARAKPPKHCPICSGLAHRVEGEQCRRCGLPWAPDSVVTLEEIAGLRKAVEVL